MIKPAYAYIKRITQKNVQTRQGYGQILLGFLARCASMALIISAVILATLRPTLAEIDENRQSISEALSDIRTDMQLSKEKIVGLLTTISHLKKDQKTLSAELVKAAAQEREAQEKIKQSDARLKELSSRKSDITKLYSQRSQEFSEILAVLERMGLRPPPAILARPDDALVAIRSSILLGAIVGQLRQKVEELNNSLQQLTILSQDIEAKKRDLSQEQEQRAEQRERLKLLLAEKAKLQIGSEQSLSAQREQNEILARKSKSLEELLADIDRQNRLVPSDNRAAMSQAASRPFAEQKGQLYTPVSGNMVKGFGKSGRQPLDGELIETQPSAVVTAPAAGKVVYSGNFRSYGNLIILDVGDDYHILLAGMQQSTVTLGQYVLSGEPIGIMGRDLLAKAAALDIGKSTPMLYIEFRKQGKPINPASWWINGKWGRKS